MWRSQHLELPTPVIVRSSDLPYRALTAAERDRVTRRVLLYRDHFTCQYCGRQELGAGGQRLLTVDHVKPAHLYPSRAEATTWENVTLACLNCNQQKGGLLPWQAGMWPGMYLPAGQARAPKEPHMVQLRFAGRLAHPAQVSYLREHYQRDPREVAI